LFKENPGTTKDIQRVKLEKINHVPLPKKSNLFTNANNVGMSRSIDAMVVDSNILASNKFHSNDNK